MKVSIRLPELGHAVREIIKIKALIIGVMTKVSSKRAFEQYKTFVEGEQWSYLAVVIDLCARRVVGWALSEKPDAQLVIEALNRTVELRGANSRLMFHSD